MSSPAQRIQLIERSLQCYLCGWLSLIPIGGLLFGTHVLQLHFRTRAQAIGQWNPAEGYLRAGCRLAALGILLHVAGFGAAAMIAVNEYL